MNKLRQEINDFHTRIRPSLEKILEPYDKKTNREVYINVVKPCKSLIQKCSFKSVYDLSRLCALTYRLYIYGREQLALEICELAREVDFVFEIWHSGVINLYGLEIRIARELFGETRSNIIPRRLLDYYFSKSVRKSLRYPKILRKEEIAGCAGAFLERVLLHALCDMIGMGETGLYNELNENWGEIEATIIEYVDFIKSMADNEELPENNLDK